jgi:hypothetical protein
LSYRDKFFAHGFQDTRQANVNETSENPVIRLFATEFSNQWEIKMPDQAANLDQASSLLELKTGSESFRKERGNVKST